MSLKSAIYTGRLRHRRFKPTGNAFTYSVCLFYLDLTEIPLLFNWPGIVGFNSPALVSFRRRDYFGDPSQSIDEAVRNRVEKETRHRPEGPIRLLTQIAYLGYCFNPVSFYYCFNKNDTKVEYILTEITNTPWHERHAYVLSCENKNSMQMFDFQKTFHVSPFMSMDFSYRWFFSEPDKKLVVHMKNFASRQPGTLFDASLTLNRTPITRWNFLLSLFFYPLMTFKTVILIYYQALKLWLKRVPFYSHPSKGVSS